MFSTSLPVFLPAPLIFTTSTLFRPHKGMFYIYIFFVLLSYYIQLNNVWKLLQRDGCILVFSSPLVPTTHFHHCQPTTTYFILNSATTLFFWPPLHSDMMGVYNEPKWHLVVPHLLLDLVIISPICGIHSYEYVSFPIFFLFTNKVFIHNKNDTLPQQRQQDGTTSMMHQYATTPNTNTRDDEPRVCISSPLLRYVFFF